MSTHNICFYKEVDKKYTGCNLKTTELLECELIGVCAVIRSNTVAALTIAITVFNVSTFRVFIAMYFHLLLYKSICWGSTFELPQQTEKRKIRKTKL